MDCSFIALDGKHYNLSPLTLGDLRAVTRHVQYQAWQDFQELKDQLDPEAFRAESQKLLHECSKNRLTEGSPEVSDYLKTLGGVVYLLYLSVKRSHNLNYDQLCDILTPEIAIEAGDKLLAVSGMLDDSKKKQVTTP
jgi:hypothetical protein